MLIHHLLIHGFLAFPRLYSQDPKRAKKKRRKVRRQLGENDWLELIECAYFVYLLGEIEGGSRAWHCPVQRSLSRTTDFMGILSYDHSDLFRDGGATGDFLGNNNRALDVCVSQESVLVALARTQSLLLSVCVIAQWITVTPMNILGYEQALCASSSQQPGERGSPR